jgi:hypothetical protein
MPLRTGLRQCHEGRDFVHVTTVTVLFRYTLLCCRTPYRKNWVIGILGLLLAGALPKKYTKSIEDDTSLSL